MRKFFPPTLLVKRPLLLHIFLCVINEINNRDSLHLVNDTSFDNKNLIIAVPLLMEGASKETLGKCAINHFSLNQFFRQKAVVSASSSTTTSTTLDHVQIWRVFITMTQSLHALCKCVNHHQCTAPILLTSTK